MWTSSHSFCLLKFTSQFTEPQRLPVSHEDEMQGRPLMEAKAEEVSALSDDVRKKTMNNWQVKGKRTWDFKEPSG